MKDYVLRGPLERAEFEKVYAEVGEEWRQFYARGDVDDVPPRRGTIAILHPLAERRQADLPAGVGSVAHLIAQHVATQTKQRVYVAMDTGGWTHVVFAMEVPGERFDKPGMVLWYDDHPGGRYANDQYIAHFDADGTYAVDGVS